MGLLFYLSSISLAFIIFQLLFPYKPRNDADFSLLRKNALRYNRMETWAIFWIFLFVVYIAFCMVFLGSQMQQYFFPKEYVYLIRPTFSFWFFPGIVLSFGLVGIPMSFLYKMILKNEYYLYMEFTNMKHGFDGEKIWRPIAGILIAAGIFIFYLGMTWYVRFENSKIVINDLTSLKTVQYNLSDISAITHSEKYINRKGIEKGIEHYMIIFNDGYTYSSHTYGFFAIQSDWNKLREQFEDLSHKTGIAIQTIRRGLN